MNLIKALLKDDDLAIQRHIAGERFPVDVVAKALRNLGAGVFMQLFYKVRGAAIFASIFIKGGARFGEIIAEMVEQSPAKFAMFFYKLRQLARGLK